MMSTADPPDNLYCERTIDVGGNGILCAFFNTVAFATAMPTLSLT